MERYRHILIQTLEACFDSGRAKRVYRRGAAEGFAGGAPAYVAEPLLRVGRQGTESQCEPALGQGLQRRVYVGTCYARRCSGASLARPRSEGIDGILGPIVALGWR